MVDATAISTGVSKFITAGVGGDTWKIPKVAYAVDNDTVGIPVEGGGDVHDNACSIDSFSGFSDPGGRFAITNESVHYHHRSGSHLLSDGYSCHGRVEQVKLNEKFSKSVSVPSPPQQDEEVMEAGDILKTLASSYETQSCRRHPPAATTAVHGARAAPPHILEGSARPPVLKNRNN